MADRKTLSITKYENGFEARFENRKIFLHTNVDGGIFQFIKRDDDMSPKARHDTIKDKIVVTTISFSEDALKAIFVLLNNYFKDTKFKPFHKDSL